MPLTPRIAGRCWHPVMALGLLLLSPLAARFFSAEDPLAKTASDAMVQARSMIRTVHAKAEITLYPPPGDRPREYEPAIPHGFEWWQDREALRYRERVRQIKGGRDLVWKSGTDLPPIYVPVAMRVGSIVTAASAANAAGAR
jgi:hypothetical protein